MLTKVLQTISSLCIIFSAFLSEHVLKRTLAWAETGLQSYNYQHNSTGTRYSHTEEDLDSGFIHTKWEISQLPRGDGTKSDDPRVSGRNCSAKHEVKIMLLYRSRPGRTFVRECVWVCEHLPSARDLRVGCQTMINTKLSYPKHCRTVSTWVITTPPPPPRERLLVEYALTEESCHQSKKGGKDRESIQSSTTSDPGYHKGKWEKYLSVLKADMVNDMLQCLKPPSDITHHIIQSRGDISAI